MTVTPLGPPVGPEPDTSARSLTNPLAEFAQALDAAGAALARAETAETAFIHGEGGLQEMVLERAQADVALSLAVATSSRVVTSLQTILGMQI